MNRPRLSPTTPTSSGKLSPVTANPKVRFLHYTISFGTDGTVDSSLALNRIFGKASDWASSLNTLLSDWLDYQLFELNESLSKDMAAFYNPLEPKQQADFKELFSGFLTPRIPENIKGFVQIQHTSFSLV